MPARCDINDDIAVLTMDFGSHNRFNRDFLKSFNGELDALERDGTARALVIINDSGNYFTEGMDIEWVMTLEKDEIVAFFLDLFRFFHRLFLYPLPVVAAMNGHAVASGLAFAMCSDYRILRENKAACVFPEVDLHIQPPPGCFRIIFHSLGTRNTELAFLSGKQYAGETALSMGFADELADAGSIRERAVSVAKEFAAKPTATYAAIKRSFRGATARAMLAEDEEFIRSSMDVGMFQGCDLTCLKSL